MSDYELRMGDCRKVLAGMDANSIDAVVTDPPYELGFMGKRWDASGVAFDPETWRAVLRVLKPGGHMLAFSGTRTYHRMVCAIEDAGFEIRDQLAWMYGSGFPKSANKARLPQGIGTALKPAQEPIVLARKPLVGTVAANVLAHGTGGINVDGCRIEGVKGVPASPKVVGASTHTVSMPGNTGTSGWDKDAGRWPANVLLDETAAAMLDAQTGTLTSGKSAGFVGDMVESNSLGRKRSMINPATVKGDSGGASRFFYVAKASRAEREAGLDHLLKHTAETMVDRGLDTAGVQNPRAGAGRGAGVPIYKCSACGLNLQGGRAASQCPKGPAHIREQVGTGASRANNHPTVKPIALMRYLVRLITPPGGIVLDPFAGSGTTLCAAVLEGHRAVGIELTPEYEALIRGRVDHWIPRKLGGLDGT